MHFKKKAKSSATAIDVWVGRRIRARREELGLTHRGLAARVGVAHQQIQKYESGKNRCSAARLLAIAEALRVPSSYLLPDGGRHQGGAGAKLRARCSSTDPERASRHSGGSGVAASAQLIIAGRIRAGPQLSQRIVDRSPRRASAETTAQHPSSQVPQPTSAMCRVLWQNSTACAEAGRRSEIPRSAPLASITRARAGIPKDPSVCRRFRRGRFRPRLQPLHQQQPELLAADARAEGQKTGDNGPPATGGPTGR